jgi:dynein heavy chain
VNKFQNFTDLAKVDHVVHEAAALHDRLSKADKDASMFNSREALLGQPLTDYTLTKKIIEQFDPFHQFWTTAASWKVG